MFFMFEAFLRLDFSAQSAAPFGRCRCHHCYCCFEVGGYFTDPVMGGPECPHFAGVFLPHLVVTKAFARDFQTDIKYSKIYSSYRCLTLYLIEHDPMHLTNVPVLLPADLLGADTLLTPGLQDKN